MSARFTITGGKNNGRTHVPTRPVGPVHDAQSDGRSMTLRRFIEVALWSWAIGYLLLIVVVR